jgi:hypothetical protein
VKTGIQFIQKMTLTLDTRWSLPQHDLSRGGYDDFEPIKIE